VLDPGSQLQEKLDGPFELLIGQPPGIIGLRIRLEIQMKVIQEDGRR